MADNLHSCTLVTGASSGIGADVARRLSGQRTVLLHGRHAERLAAVRSECDALRPHAIWLQDFKKTDELESSLMQVLTQHNMEVSEWVHCAGDVAVLPVRQVGLSLTRRLFDVNVMSVFALLPLLLGRGVLSNVVVVSSAASLCGEKGVALYSATKGALNAMVRSLTLELSPDVRVNAVLPGLTETPMARETLSAPGACERLAKKYPLGVGQPQDVSAAVEFLLSESSSWITGQCLVVDGGRTLV